MGGIRKKFEPALKARVALEALKGEKNAISSLTIRMKDTVSAGSACYLALTARLYIMSLFPYQKETGSL